MNAFPSSAEIIDAIKRSGYLMEQEPFIPLNALSTGDSFPLGKS